MEGVEDIGESPVVQTVKMEGDEVGGMCVGGCFADRQVEMWCLLR